MFPIDQLLEMSLTSPMSDMLKAIVLGIVEGLTEFLPVSSTGHLIIANKLLGYTGEEAATFDVFIQLGAILAVVFYFRTRFIDLVSFKKESGFTGRNGIGFLLLTTLPALIVGYFAHDVIKNHLFSVQAVAIGLAAGAIWILLTEKFYRHDDPKDLDQLTWITALGIGVFQCFAMWPGMSRSACTILGAMFLGLRRKAATEYSFFAAVPIMLAACLFDIVKSRELLHQDMLPFFAVGFIAAFFSALAAVKFFIGYVSRHSFFPFAWYRLLVAAALAWWISSG
jgi:undecaprenyl-diphosphatase